jgi:hypothetical protein
MHNGAVLNGQFYAVGDALPEWAYPDKAGTRLTIPHLVSVDTTSIVIGEDLSQGHDTLLLKAVVD